LGKSHDRHCTRNQHRHCHRPRAGPDAEVASNTRCIWAMRSLSLQGDTPMSANSAFEKLAELGRKLEAIEHAQSMLSVDEAVMMPHGGGEKRAESMAMLAGMYHEMATAPEIADWLAAASEEPLDDWHQAAIREQSRVYTNMTCLSTDFVRRQV